VAGEQLFGVHDVTRASLSSIRYDHHVAISVKVVMASRKAVRHGHPTFDGLPSRLRHEEVDGQRPAEIGPDLCLLLKPTDFAATVKNEARLEVVIATEKDIRFGGVGLDDLGERCRRFVAVQCLSDSCGERTEEQNCRYGERDGSHADPLSAHQRFRQQCPRDGKQARPGPGFNTRKVPTSKQRRSAKRTTCHQQS
jgi:hypothetical protein